jgi:hypothetical protein
MQTKSLFFGMLFYTLFRMVVVTLNIVNVILYMSEPSLLRHPLNCSIHLRVLLDNTFLYQSSFYRHMSSAPCNWNVCIWSQLVISPDSFIPEKWGPCSVTCGQGFRKREVQCKIFLEFSKTIARLPDVQCQGPKPSEVERCLLEPCSSQRYFKMFS